MDGEEQRIHFKRGCTARMIAANSVTVNLVLVLGLFFFFFEICEDFDKIDFFL